MTVLTKQANKLLKPLFSMSSILLLTPFFSACAPHEEALSFGQPVAFALLDGLEIQGQLIAFADDDEQTEACSGKIANQEALQRNGDRFIGALDLRPGKYKLCVEFRLSSDNILISRYQDIPLDIKTGDDLIIGDSFATYYVDRDDKAVSEYDFDEDGIINIDELLFGLDIRTADKVQRPDNVELPAPASGQFFIGRNGDDALAVESPGVTKTVGHFWIDKFEVNRRAYALCVAKNICPLPMNSNKLDFAASLGQKPTEQDSDAGLNLDDKGLLPITSVTQGAAISFCTMHNGRLPKEEEWEYAAIPNQGPYPWSGDSTMEALFEQRSQCAELNARYPSNNSSEPAQSCYDPEQDYHGNPISTLAFGFGSNPNHALACSSTPGHPGDNAGPCQMAGNVWEWTASAFGPYPGASWTASDGLITVRGGSADSLSQSLRSTFRLGVRAHLEDQHDLAKLLGFRCVYDDAGTQ